jgi:thiamine transport system ATP-binding protein
MEPRDNRSDTPSGPGDERSGFVYWAPEFLGDAYRLHCRWGDRTLLAKTAGENPPAGAVTLGIDPDAVTVVEREEGAPR